METPILERIESLRQREQSLSSTQARIRKLIMPYQLTLHKIQEEKWEIAKEKLALQADLLLEGKEEEKKQARLDREIALLAKEYGDEAAKLMLEILNKKEETE